MFFAETVADLEAGRHLEFYLDLNPYLAPKLVIFS